jgi:hypothetical protein
MKPSTIHASGDRRCDPVAAPSAGRARLGSRIRASPPCSAVLIRVPASRRAGRRAPRAPRAPPSDRCGDTPRAPRARHRDLVASSPREHPRVATASPGCGPPHHRHDLTRSPRDVRQPCRRVRAGARPGVCPPAAVDRASRPRYRGRPGGVRERRWSQVQADSLDRPRRRRSLTIVRPARVRMRERKPCLRLRRRLLGWKVRFTAKPPGEVVMDARGGDGLRRTAFGCGIPDGPTRDVDPPAVRVRRARERTGPRACRASGAGWALGVDNPLRVGSG